MFNINSVYIHIPYCKSKCNYCAFYSVVKNSFNDYEKLIIDELSLYRKNYDFSNLKTIYFGGGTPSLLKCRQITDIINSIGSNSIKEITVEVNPGTVDYEKLKCLKGNGVNRLSIGIQSMDDNTLLFLGRIHNSNDNISAFNMARKAGFDNISVDLIIGIPGYSKSTDKTLKTIVKLNPEHISAYILSIEKGTKFNKWVEAGTIIPTSEEVVRGEYLMLCGYLGECGYDHYEISNFAREGKESIHNLSYWQGDKYIGLGPSASGYNGKIRYRNVNNTKIYRDKILKGEFPIEDKEQLSYKNKLNEFIFLNLRLRKGLNIGQVKKRFGIDILSEKGDKMLAFEKRGLLVISEDIIKLTDEGFLVSDFVFSELIF